MENTNTITVQATVNAPLEKVWKLWTGPEHIKAWNNASDDWHTPHAEVDLRPEGKFLSRMEAKDGSAGFDFEGIFSEVVPNQKIAYAMSDGRKVEVLFEGQNGHTHIRETFDPENTHSLELQQAGWQSILDNFKKYAETVTGLETMHFEILIHAPAEKVYRLMLEDTTYREWTSVFCAGSYYKGSWEKGSSIHFIGPDGEGNEGGMVSRIRENLPNRFVSIEHLGILQNGQEIMEGPQVDAWAGALENYAFSEENGQTRLKVSIDTGSDYKDYFSNTWPLALEKLKTICEV